MSGQIAFYAPGQKLAAEAQLAADGVTVAEVREHPYVIAPHIFTAEADKARSFTDEDVREIEAIFVARARAD